MVVAVVQSQHDLELARDLRDLKTVARAQAMRQGIRMEANIQIFIQGYLAGCKDTVLTAALIHEAEITLGEIVTCGG